MKTKNPGSENGNSALHELFLEELADMYNAERQLTMALPKLAKATQSSELREAFESHLEETKNHVARIEQVFSSLNEEVHSKRCDGIKGILSEGEAMVKEQKGTSALDAALISGAQKVEHYEIASYGTLVAWAEQMGQGEAASLLKQSLDEEKKADEKLTELAMASANEEAD